MLRTFVIVSLLAILAGCQTGSTDTAGTLSSATGAESVADSDTGAEGLQVLDADGNVVTPDEQSADTETPVAEQTTDASAASDNQRSADRVVAGVQDIAAIRNTKGEPAAVLAVFACYKKARERAVSLTAARICAAQDFVVSREVISKRPSSATGTNDRALLVSKRHPERIGALMKLKGMNQSQFNTFGSYLHAIAEPEYQKARKS